MRHSAIDESVKMTRFPRIWNFALAYDCPRTAFVIAKSATANEFVVWTAYLSDSGIVNLTGGRYFSNYRDADAAFAVRLGKS